LKHPEYHLQKQACQWLNLQHPALLWMTDTIAAVKLTMGQAVRNKAVQKPGFKCPDLIIFQPNTIYNGLFIELKSESPYLKSGKLSSDKHIQGQADTMEQLRAKGYCCHFAWTLEQVQEIVNEYLSLKI
jgi:hypothetical protein